MANAEQHSHAGGRKVSQQEWMRRYTQAFVDGGCSLDEAQKCAKATTFETARGHFEDDPEGAAQEEMSYWD